MDQDELKEKFENNYADDLGVDFQTWILTAPKNTDEAYKRCIEIDKLLNATYDEWYEATGDKRDQLEEQRQKWKNEYDMLEELFGLDFQGRNL